MQAATMQEPSTPSYGLWSLVIVNSLVFIVFAFSFAKQQSSRRLGANAAAVLVVLASTALVPPGLAQDTPAWATQSSSRQGVTVKVTPKPASPGSTQWEFTIVLDTHSGDLGDDLNQAVTLVTDDAREYKPTTWSGAGPGGHHREGVLAFAVPQPWPRAFELRLQRGGEAEPRRFRWGD